MRRIAFMICTLLLAAFIAIFITGRAEDSVPLPLEAKATHIVVSKSAHSMALFDGDRILRTYKVALGRGGLAAKVREGDNLNPEGNYTISGRNIRSAYHLSLRISYPTPAQQAEARAQGVSPGGDIMIHGIRNGLGWIGIWHRRLDWTAGCIAVTDQEMDEIWRIVPDGIKIEIRP